ncbi:hypothetical protein K8I85_12135 [bacterium]|nr:hypothetical protein [bacterium]
MNEKRSTSGQRKGDRRKVRKRAVATPHEQLMGELLRLKEEFLKRSPGYREEVEQLCTGLPGEHDDREWTEDDFRKLEAFVLKWDTEWLSPDDLREHPYGAHRWAWDEGYGVVHLSSAESDLLVIGIDVRHNAKEIGSWVKRLVRDVRAHRQSEGDPEHRWRPFAWKGKTHRFGPDTGLDTRSVMRRRVHYWTGTPEEGDEALKAREMAEAGKSPEEIRDYLFPDSADLPDGHAAWRWVNLERDPASALKKATRRLELATEMIEGGGYRQLLPLVGARSRLEAIEQWERSRKPEADAGHEEGG